MGPPAPFFIGRRDAEAGSRCRTSNRYRQAERRPRTLAVPSGKGVEPQAGALAVTQLARKKIKSLVTLVTASTPPIG
jgi:hypothetical protein